MSEGQITAYGAKIHQNLAPVNSDGSNKKSEVIQCNNRCSPFSYAMRGEYIEDWYELSDIPSIPYGIWPKSDCINVKWQEGEVFSLQDGDWYANVVIPFADLYELEQRPGVALCEGTMLVDRYSGSAKGGKANIAYINGEMYKKYTPPKPKSKAKLKKWEEICIQTVIVALEYTGNFKQEALKDAIIKKCKQSGLEISSTDAWKLSDILHSSYENQKPSNDITLNLNSIEYLHQQAAEVFRHIIWRGFQCHESGLQYHLFQWCKNWTKYDPEIEDEPYVS